MQFFVTPTNNMLLCYNAYTKQTEYLCCILQPVAGLGTTEYSLAGLEGKS